MRGNASGASEVPAREKTCTSAMSRDDLMTGEGGRGVQPKGEKAGTSGSQARGRSEAKSTSRGILGDCSLLGILGSTKVGEPYADSCIL